MKIRKNDNVIVIAGKDKGSEGKVLRVFPREFRAIVEGVNMKKKHTRARRAGTKGQIVSFASPVHVSNIALKDPKTGKPTRVGFDVKKGNKVRVAKKSGSVL